MIEKEHADFPYFLHSPIPSCAMAQRLHITPIYSPADRHGHVTIRFSDSTAERIEMTHPRVRLSRYGMTLDMMDTWTAGNMVDAHVEALSCEPPNISVEDAAIGRYASDATASVGRIFANFD